MRSAWFTAAGGSLSGEAAPGSSVTTTPQQEWVGAYLGSTAAYGKSEIQYPWELARKKRITAKKMTLLERKQFVGVGMFANRRLLYLMIVFWAGQLLELTNLANGSALVYIIC